MKNRAFIVAEKVRLARNNARHALLHDIAGTINCLGDQRGECLEEDIVEMMQAYLELYDQDMMDEEH